MDHERDPVDLEAKTTTYSAIAVKAAEPPTRYAVISLQGPPDLDPLESLNDLNG